MTRLVSYLGRYQGDTPATADDLHAAARAAWRKRGWLGVDVASMDDDWERQMLTNIGDRLFGPRDASEATRSDGAAITRSGGAHAW